MPPFLFPLFLHTTLLSLNTYLSGCVYRMAVTEQSLRKPDYSQGSNIFFLLVYAVVPL
jgi:hypothetical protein